MLATHVPAWNSGHHLVVLGKLKSQVPLREPEDRYLDSVDVQHLAARVLTCLPFHGLAFLEEMEFQPPL